MNQTLSKHKFFLLIGLFIFVQLLVVYNFTNISQAAISRGCETYDECTTRQDCEAIGGVWIVTSSGGMVQPGVIIEEEGYCVPPGGTSPTPTSTKTPTPTAIPTSTLTPTPTSTTTQTPTPTPTSTPTPTPTGCGSYTTMGDCEADENCDWVFLYADPNGLEGYCKDAEPPPPGCLPSSLTYSNYNANFTYRSECYNVSNQIGSSNITKSFTAPSEFLNFYFSGLPTFKTGACPGSSLKTQICFYPDPDNSAFRSAWFFKKASSYTFQNSCVNCTMNGGVGTRDKLLFTSGDISCGPSYSTAPAISLTATENTASAQYTHSVSINKGKWEGYSINDAKKTLIYDFSIDKTKISKIGEPVTLHWKIINGPGYSSTGGGSTGGGGSFPPGEPRTRQEDPNAPPPGWDGGGGFLYPLKQFSLETVKNTIAQLFGISKKAEALENYPTEEECLAHGCDWVLGAYNPWDPYAPAGCICPYNYNTSISVPSSTNPPIIALVIGNATCKPEGDASDCPFHPNQIYPLVTSVSNVEPANSFSVKNIFQKLFGLISSTQAQTVTAFEKTYEGQLTLYPQSATNFYLITYGLIGEGSGYILSDPVQVDIATYNPSVDLKVQKSPGHDFVDGPVWIDKGDDVVLAWSSKDVVSCKASANPANTYWNGDVMTVNAGYTVPDIVTSTTFIITCKATNGTSVSDSVTVSIGKPKTPIVTIDASPTTVSEGANTTLTWTSVNVSSCTASSTPFNAQWTGNVATSGSKQIANLTQSTTFSISCDNNNASSNVTVNVVPQVATINIVARLDGQVWNGNVNYTLSGPTVISGTQPQSYNVAIQNAQGDLYSLIYQSGGPTNASFVGLESQSRVIKPADNVTFYLDFSTLNLCQIDVTALYNNQPWNGKLSYLLIGPTILTGNIVPYTFSAVPPGVYYISYISGGPDNFIGVELRNALTCPQSGSISFSLKFGTTPTPTPVIPPAEIGDNPPTAKIGCVADDMTNCSGTIDGDNNTPTITLYNASTDPDGDIKICQWAVAENPSLNKTSCSPLVIGDTIGNYSVTLTVTDSKGHSSQTSVVAKVKDVTELTPKFVWDPFTPVVGKETRFFDRSLTPKGTSLKTWSWSFEGANIATSTDPNPTVIFTSVGPKNVTLTVKNSANEIKSITQKIDVRAAAPEWKEVIPR